MYSVVLFDLDHTLLDSDASQHLAYIDVMEAFGIADADAHRAAYEDINAQLWAEVERGNLSPNDVRLLRFSRFVEERRLDADPEAMANRYIRGLGDFGELFPDALAVLDSVRDNARVGLVTNGIGEVQRARLERLNLAGRFEVVVISGEVGVAKPGTEIFDLAFAGMPGADRAHTLMIGDSLTSDIAGGVNAGIDTCWFDRGGAHPNPNSAEPSPTYRITHLSEIPAVVAG